MRNKGKHIMLFVPGRIGTSSPELGVPTTFADISEFDVICEVAERSAGYMPELSYGSHIFQDLVEADILYGAVFDNEKTVIFQPELLHNIKNMLTNFYPEGKNLEEIIGVYSVEDAGCMIYHDMNEERQVFMNIYKIFKKKKAKGIFGLEENVINYWTTKVPENAKIIKENYGIEYDVLYAICYDTNKMKIKKLLKIMLKKMPMEDVKHLLKTDDWLEKIFFIYLLGHKSKKHKKKIVNDFKKNKDLQQLEEIVLINNLMNQ